MRGELMLLECGVEECSRALANLRLRLDNMQKVLARIICEMGTND